MADYSAALLRGLRKLGSVEVNRPADIALYHIGNNQLHHEIYQRALSHPGVVAIHDAVIHHYFLGALSESEYIAEFTYNYGDWMADCARELWRGRARSATDPRYFRYPMLRRIAETSLGVVVHNPAATRVVKEHAPGARVAEIPHLFDPPALPPAYDVERLRRQLGCSGQTLLCGVFGYLRESKRLAGLLRTFTRVREKADVRLLVAGQFASGDLARSVEDLLASPGIVRTGYLSEGEFWRHAAAVDVCVNLRYPAAGESSGIAIRLMGIGKPVILTDGPESVGFPTEACLRADSGENEEEEVAAYLLWLAADAGSRAAIGTRAAAFIWSEHALDRAARLYWDLLRDCYDTHSGIQPPV